MATNLKKACLEIFRESFEGVALGKSGTWYVQGKEGIFDAIETATPEQASVLLPGARATIGAHANHLCYYLHLFNASCRGEREEGDWEGSWRVQNFDATTWADVINRTHHEFDEAFDWYQAQADQADDIDDKDMAAYTIANIAHAAFHLGAIRAMLPIVLASAQNPKE